MNNDSASPRVRVRTWVEVTDKSVDPPVVTEVFREGEGTLVPTEGESDGKSDEPR
jgi:hypothetical protein